MNSPSFKFSCLVAVSTEDQATEDKDSLDVQFQRSHDFGERLGGTFTREYRADGFSRSGWFDLTPALEACTAFWELAQDARAHLFDVVIVESYDRLGDLGLMFFNFFAAHGPPYIQIISVQQKIMIEDPAVYHPRRDDSIPNAIAESLKVNKYRTNKIFRAFEVGINNRIHNGLYAQRVPQGYIRVPKQTPLLDPTVASLLVHFPEWFLSGESTETIAARAKQSGVPSAKGKSWTPNVVKNILQNPFYSGRVFHGRGYRDKVTKTYRYKKNFETYPGLHEALWTWDTHLKIMAEFERRIAHRQTNRDYNFTGLLRCAECNRTLIIAYDTRYSERKYWKCPNKHVHIRADLINQLAGEELRRVFSSDEVISSQQESVKDFTARELATIRRRLQRLDQENDAGAYTPLEFAERRKQLKARETELQDEERQQQIAKRKRTEQESNLLTLRELASVFPEWVVSVKPTEVKHALASAGVYIIVNPNKTIKVEINA